MEIILLERVEKLGQMGDVVSGKPGYARNYLLPQGKALRAHGLSRSRRSIEEQMPVLSIVDTRESCSYGNVLHSLS